MSGFWSSATMRRRLPTLIKPYADSRIVSCSYELGLGAEVFITGEETKTKRTLNPGEQVRIPPGQFANLLTEEQVTIPPDALGLISMKFKLKQRGLVNVSGFHVDPGYSGNLLFSVYNAGAASVIISRGNPTFLLWLSDLDAETDDLYNKGPRTSITDEDVSHLQGEIATPQALAIRVESLERRLQNWNWSWKIVVGAVVTGFAAYGISQIPHF
jgi:dCTP deaminase